MQTKTTSKSKRRRVVNSSGDLDESDEEYEGGRIRTRKKVRRRVGKEISWVLMLDHPLDLQLPTTRSPQMIEMVHKDMQTPRSPRRSLGLPMHY